VATPRLSRLELQIMDVLWTRGPLSIRQVQEAFSERRRLAYATIQTTIYRLEGKKADHRLRRSAMHISLSHPSAAMPPMAD